MKKIAVCLFSILLISSCEKNQDLSSLNPMMQNEVSVLVPSSAKEVNSKSLRTSYKDGIDEYENFVVEIAKMLKDKELRIFLKEEALKQFDGDYDILVKSHLNKFKKFEALVNETPTLNIGFNELIKEWDCEKNTILVTLAIGIKPESKTLTAYDSNGKKYEIDAKTEPDKPIIVIGYNERVKIENGSIKIMKFQKTSTIPSSNLRITSCSYPFRSGPAQYERLKEIKFEDLSEYEEWYHFKPEIQFRIYAPTSASNFTSVGLIVENFYKPDRGDVNGSWCTLDAPLFLWLTPQYTTTMLYEFTEIDDFGQVSTNSIGLSQSYGVGSNNSAGTPNITSSITPSFGHSTTKKADDKVIGRHPVEMLYCPPNSDGSYQFNAGSTAFYYKAGY